MSHEPLGAFSGEDEGNEAGETTPAQQILDTVCRLKREGVEAPEQMLHGWALSYRRRTAVSDLKDHQRDLSLIHI